MAKLQELSNKTTYHYKTLCTRWQHN